MNKYVYTLSYMWYTSSVDENETMLWLGVVIDIRVCTSLNYYIILDGLVKKELCACFIMSLIGCIVYTCI